MDQINVYTGGTFDLLHFGHLNLLQKCRQFANGGRVIVGLNSDEFVREYKGIECHDKFEVRKMNLMKSGYVSEVVLNSGGRDSKIIIESVQPDLIVVGSDWAKKDYYSQMDFSQDWLDDRGISLAFVPYTKGISSSLLRKNKES